MSFLDRTDYFNSTEITDKTAGKEWTYQACASNQLYLNWRKNKPLFYCRIPVTAAEETSGGLSIAIMSSSIKPRQVRLWAKFGKSEKRLMCKLCAAASFLVSWSNFRFQTRPRHVRFDAWDKSPHGPYKEFRQDIFIRRCKCCSRRLLFFDQEDWSFNSHSYIKYIKHSWGL